MSFIRNILEIRMTASPSLNKLKNKWIKYYKWKKLYIKELSLYSLCFNILDNPRKRKIRVIRYGSRMFDKDNFIGGCKPLIDALKSSNLIYDDRQEFLESKYEQIKCKRGCERIIIQIWEC